MSVGEEAFHRLSARYIGRSHGRNDWDSIVFLLLVYSKGISRYPGASFEPHYSSLKPLPVAVAFCFIMIAGEIGLIGVAEMNRAYC